ncbi:MAG: histidine triad nucleotide-binding protein [Proteobacteria bacterium]|jgi:histidine triad (HIT) family protein|nr:histidine triad nucleotide-binding protein [Pseudomonadota bacterium]
MGEVDCVFCKIVSGAIPAKKLYEDDAVVAFDDAHPAAPIHFLVIPKIHVDTLDDVGKEHAPLLGRMLVVAARLAREKGVGATGYRQVINCRKAAGQVVYHLHAHVLGGRDMRRMG